MNMSPWCVDSCAPAASMLQTNGDLKRKWTTAVYWLNDELERVGVYPVLWVACPILWVSILSCGWPVPSCGCLSCLVGGLSHPGGRGAVLSCGWLVPSWGGDGRGRQSCLVGGLSHPEGGGGGSCLVGVLSWWCLSGVVGVLEIVKNLELRLWMLFLVFVFI